MIKIYYESCSLLHLICVCTFAVLIVRVTYSLNVTERLVYVDIDIGVYGRPR